MVTQKQMFVSEELKKKKKKNQQQKNKQTNNTKKCKNSYEIYPEPIIDK